MSQDVQQNELSARSQQLLQGPLKHARTAALALALVPLAAVAASTEVNESCVQSAGICGTVFYDSNNNGMQDESEPGIGGASVTIVGMVEGEPMTSTVMTNPQGFFDFGTDFPQQPDPYGNRNRNRTRSPCRCRRTPLRHHPTREAMTPQTVMALATATATASRRSRGPRTRARIPAPTSDSRRRP